MSLSPAQQKLVLTTALTFIPDEKSWVQHNLALDASGQGCEPDDPQAVRFCLRGAIRRSLKQHGFDFHRSIDRTSLDEEDACRPILNALHYGCRADDLARWQNRATFEKAHRALEQGIALIPA